MVLPKDISIVYFAPSTRSHPMVDVLGSLGARVHVCYDDLEALAIVLRGDCAAVCVEQLGQTPERFYRILRRRAQQQPLMILAVLPENDPVQSSHALLVGADAVLVAAMAPDEVEAILGAQARICMRQEELLRDHQTISRAMDYVDEGIMLMNREGRVLHANRKCLAMLDLDPDVLRERSVPQLLNVLGVPRDTIDRVMDSEEAFLESIDLHTVDGTREVVVDCRRLPDAAAAGERRWLVQLRDASLLHTLDRLQDDFHTWAAHELRSHLSLLTAEVDALEDGDVSRDRAAMTESLRREVENLAAAIEERLESLGGEGEQPASPLGRVTLLGCVEGAMAEVEALALARGQRLRLDLDRTDGDFEFRARVQPLQQALRYVLVAALSGTEDGVELLLSPYLEGRDLHLRLSSPAAEESPGSGFTENFERAQRLLRDEGGELRRGLGASVDIQLRLPVILSPAVAVPT